MSRLKTLFSLYAPQFAQQAENAAVGVRDAYENIGRYLNIAIPLDINHYHCYPYLFSAAFPSVTEEQLHQVAVAGVLYLDHLCILDRIVDSPVSVEPYQSVLGAMLHERSAAILREIFSSDSKFWNDLESLNLKHGSAVLREKSSHRYRIAQYGEGEFFALATGKAGVSKATHIALAHLANSFVDVESLSRSQDYFNAAFQAYDDVKDWREDLQAGNYSDILTRVLLDMGVKVEEVGDGRAIAADLSHHLYYDGVAEDVLMQALEYCQSAQSAVEGLPVDSWIKLNQAFSRQIKTLHDDLQRTRLQTILRSRGFLSRKQNDLINAGLAYLQNEHACGYPEAAHTMGFLWNRSDRPTRDIQTASVFQRAIIADVLLDAHEASLIDFTQGSDAECKTLLGLRLQNVRGGWSYFPSLENLPPDADDLGQVMQVLARTRHHGITQIDDDLDLLFRHSTYDDGSFETWIVDRGSNDPATLAMIAAIEDCWGNGKDVEVISNLGYGLLLYAPERFVGRIQSAAKYVEGQQTRSGQWIPTWYASSYYGTYVAVRFLVGASLSSPALLRTSEHFLSSQYLDGGFGDDSSTPLETALALLCINLLPIPQEYSDRIVGRAIRYLELTVREDGTWNASNFIQMDVHRAQKGTMNYAPQWLYYKSRTITTGYVVKSLIVLRKAR